MIYFRLSRGDNKAIRKAVSILLIIAILIIFTTQSILPVSASEVIGSIPVGSSYDRSDNYYNYKLTYEDKMFSDTEIVIPGSSYILDSTADVIKVDSFENRSDVVKIENAGGDIDYEINVPKSGLYNIEISYYPLPGYRADIEFGLKINGLYPFNESRKLNSTRVWKDSNGITQDNRGNDIRPSQIESPIWQACTITDTEGLYNEAYSFYFEEGANLLSINLTRAGFAIDQIRLYTSVEVKEYNEIKEYYQSEAEEIKGYFYKRQGQEAILKSSPQLVPIYDRSSPATEPSSPSNLKLNTIGGLNWKMPGQWITWEVEVEEDGLYEIGFKYRQNFVRGFFTTRRMYIDGEVPFAEMNNIRFNFSNNWEMQVLGDGNEAYQFYLEKGTREIKLEVTIGDIADTLRRLEDVVFDLNDLYRQILMIMGTNPDIYRDYFLEREIPDFIEILERNSQILKEEALHLEQLTGKKGSEASQLETIAYQLDGIIRRPDSMKERLDHFKSNVSILASWILRIKEQPLELDYLFVKSPDVKAPSARANFFSNLMYTIKSFFASFVVDYSSVGNVYDEETSLRVWIFGGRDQAQIGKSMIDDMFTKETGISVNLELVQAGMIEAILSGVNPDVIMNVGRGDPVNLSARGALVSLSEFEGFDDVAQRFSKYAMTPYKYNGEYYGLPVQQDFNVMFYRADILSELGIEIPRTWKEFYEVTPKIQRSNMQIGIPSGGVVAQMGMPAGYDIFAALLLQNGGEFYNDDRTKTMFDDQRAVESFSEWTSFFADYSFPVQYDFYNRFRTGEMPLAIQSYSQYNLLMVGAPEIRNLWGIAPVPGTVKEDGTIDRTIPGSGSATIILKKSEMQKQAWEFIKWWTDTESQLRYGTELETLMGAAARYNTANTEALKLLPWSEPELQVLLKQREWLKEIPEIPASYYVNRSINNAFRNVVYNANTNPREVLFEYNNKMNNEIERKNEELGYARKGE